MNVFILCAGDGDRWGNYLGVPKQLIRFGSETILERTIRLSSVYRNACFFCVTRDQSIAPPNTVPIVLKHSSCLVDTIGQTRSYWASRNIFLLGDVFYSPTAIHMIFHSTRYLTFFGRPWPSFLVKCGHGELFGMAFDIEALSLIPTLLDTGMRLQGSGHAGNLWNLHHIASGLPLGTRFYSKELLELIDDYTNDIDTQDDYRRRSDLFERITKGRFGTKLDLWIHQWVLLPRRYQFARNRSVAQIASIAERLGKLL